jgi:hypothetical protein
MMSFRLKFADYVDRVYLIELEIKDNTSAAIFCRVVTTQVNGVLRNNWTLLILTMCLIRPFLT